MKKTLFYLFLTLSGSLAAQTTIVPHFTDQSKEVAIPADADVSPKIHDGMIMIWYGYGKLAFVNTQGEYVFGTNFPISTINNLHYEDSHFSGGAIVRKAGAGYAILYPDGTYRDLPKDISFVSAFCDGYARANKGTNAILGIKQGFINAQGSEVFPAITSTLTGTLGDNKIYLLRENRRVYFDAKLKKYGYADEKGAVAIKPQFDKALSFSEG
ncbi:MAG: WG repeat-containing protein, partial [Dysgonamonadaceae bacterium]|nr:WG repeat-containing protein [Dysgonamonadaceae bacterium]